MDTYEKKYKDILARLEEAKNVNDVCDERYCCVINDIIPELNESEDERIRKRLIDFFEDWRENRSHCCGIAVSKILTWLEKQGEQNLANSVRTRKDEPFDYENANIQQKDFASKNEPKFKVKYAGIEYNVLEVKDIAGVTYYGIEDEPNHIDYVQAENCERVGGYSIKENGSPYPTKPAMFSEQKPAWSEEDNKHYESCLNYFEEIKPDSVFYKDYLWLKTIKERINV